MNIDKKVFCANLLSEFSVDEIKKIIKELDLSSLSDDACDDCVRIGSSEWCNSCVRGDKFDNFKEKPEIKVIDLMSLVCSSIDMEFQSTFHGEEWWWTGSLISNDFSKGYESKEGYWPNCRIRKNHIHFLPVSWVLPDGLRVRLHFINIQDNMTVITGSNDWNQILQVRKNNIIGFECLGTGPGYKYGWEEKS